MSKAAHTPEKHPEYGWSVGLVPRPAETVPGRYDPGLGMDMGATAIDVVLDRDEKGRQADNADRSNAKHQNADVIGRIATAMHEIKAVAGSEIIERGNRFYLKPPLLDQEIAEQISASEAAGAVRAAQYKLPS